MGLSQISSFQTEHIFTIDSQEDLFHAFRARDQKKLVLPERLKFPMNVRSYFTWKEPSGVYTYLIFKMPNWDTIRGVAFKRMSSAGEPTGGLCNWCHAYGSSEDIGMMSVTSDPQTSRSYFLCQDLRCIEKIEEATMLSGKVPEKYIADLYAKMEKLFENLNG